MEMDKFLVASIVCAVLATLLMIKGFSNLLVRDKRYNKGVKKRFNYVSLIIFGIAIFTFYLAFRFYNLI